VRQGQIQTGFVSSSDDDEEANKRSLKQALPKQQSYGMKGSRLVMTEFEQSSHVCTVCPSSTLPSLPPTLLLFLIKEEKIQNKSNVHLETTCILAGSHSSPFSDLIIDHCCVYNVVS